MKTIQLSKLKEQHKFVCEQYLQKFINKQGYEFSGWIPSDQIGGIACFIEQYFFGMDDIIYDINEKCPKGLIFSWQDDNLDAGYDHMINYHSYATGLRHSDIVEPETTSHE